MDGVSRQVLGEGRWTPGPSPWPWLAGAALLAIGLVVAAWRLRRPAWLAMLRIAVQLRPQSAIRLRMTLRSACGVDEADVGQVDVGVPVVEVDEDVAAFTDNEGVIVGDLRAIEA